MREFFEFIRWACIQADYRKKYYDECVRRAMLQGQFDRLAQNYADCITRERCFKHRLLEIDATSMGMFQ
jgi:hypothetical protein